MKRIRKLKLNTRLLAVFFVAVFLLSLGNFFVYSHLLNTLEQEERVINVQQLQSVAGKVSAVLENVRGSYITMTRTETFQRFASSQPDYYEMIQLGTAAQDIFDENPYIHGWMLFFRESDHVVTNNGSYPKGEYITQFYQHEDYSPDFWQEKLNDGVPMQYLAEGLFRSLAVGEDREKEKRLMPMVIKDVWEGDMMTVLMLDMQKLCREKDDYLTEGLYIFTEEGQLVYASDAEPVITALPEQELVDGPQETLLAVQGQPDEDGLIYIKLLPQSQARSQIHSNFLLCLGLALTALVVAVILGAVSIHRVMDPVNRMVGMLHAHSDSENENITDAYQALEQLIRKRDQQAQALAEQEAALSQYILQSKLKNVYAPGRAQVMPEEAEGTVHILYIQVRYEEKNRGLFSMSWAELENCLQEMMSDTLRGLFDSTMIFQLEPGRFIAQVRLLAQGDSAKKQAEKFMKRLSQEEEFARFTVVLSQPLAAQEELAGVYDQVREASRMAVVNDRSQLLVLPLGSSKMLRFRYSYQDEQRLYACAKDGQTSEAVAVANQILDHNLSLGLSHVQMEMLCVALVNTTSYAVAQSAGGEEKSAAASGVYSVLTSKCSEAREYCDAVTGFIRSAVVSTGAPEEETADPLLQKVQQYLTENYHREFSGEEMAEALWVSRSYLSSYYKNKTGQNLSDSIQRYRIEKAVELLKDPAVKIGEVGARVGIPSSNTFLRQFKKYTGMTPKEYRLKNNME